MRFSDISAIICIAVVSLIGAGLVAFSRTIPEDFEDAAAVVLKSDVEFELLEIIASSKFSATGEKTQFCVDSEAELDFERLNKHFAGLHLEAVDASSCFVKCNDEGNWSLVSPSNGDAFVYGIYGVSCSWWTSCIIGVAAEGSGGKYQVKKTEGNWSVNDQFSNYISNVGPRKCSLLEN